MLGTSASRTRRRLRCVLSYCASAKLPLLLFVSAGCEGEPKAEPVAVERVEIDAGKTTLGFATGTLRSDTDVEAFAIARHPVTRGQYSACVEAEACVEVACTARPGTFEQADQLPVDCVSFAQASRFCEWVGGTLPTFSQWLKAARGPAPRRFPWGDARPTCKQHPLAGTALSALSGAADARFGRGVSRCEVPVQAYTVGQHDAAAFVGGMEDALLTPAELVRSEGASPFGACRDDGSGCVVYGLEAGAIDGVSDIDADGSAGYGVGFRCAWEK